MMNRLIPWLLRLFRAVAPLRRNDARNDGILLDARFGHLYRNESAAGVGSAATAQ
jgi:hypothetical protein